jgi:hypothetical protein
MVCGLSADFEQFELVVNAPQREYFVVMIRFQYQPTFKDYLALQCYSFFKGLGTRAVPIIIIFGGIILLNIFGSHSTEGTRTLLQVCEANRFILIIPAAVVLGLAFVYWTSRKRWNASKELRSAKEYVVDDAGVHAKGEGISVSREWSSLKGADFKGGYFFLRSGQHAYHYFPATVVPDRKTFVDLVSSKVKATRNFKASGSE